MCACKTKKKTIKPSVKQMLLIGRDIGHETLEEAYQQYMSHYDCFFLISGYKNQYHEFINELKQLTLLDCYQEDGKDVYQLKNITIDEALKLCEVGKVVK